MKIKVEISQELINDIAKQTTDEVRDLACMLTAALESYEKCYGSDLLIGLFYAYPEPTPEESAKKKAMKIFASMKGSTHQTKQTKKKAKRK